MIRPYCRLSTRCMSRRRHFVTRPRSHQLTLVPTRITSIQPFPFRIPLSLARQTFASSSSSNGEPFSRWKLFARIVRYIRIPLLVASVYSLGYQQGIIEYARNPTELKEALLNSVLASVGCRDKSGVSSIRDIDSSRMFSKANREVRKVARIGGKIMIAAKALAAQKQAEAIEAVQSTLPTDISKENLVAILDEDFSYQRWTTAVEQLDGNWTYMLIDSQLPNAFVTEIMPRHIFITTSMLNIIGNEDELALVLGHELSHMLLGHISEKNMVETMLRTVEVLLLSMDPTSGVLSLLFVGSLATLRTAFTAAHSREHEHEADGLGIQLAAMACFDTRKAASVFQKLHEQAGAPNGKRLLSFADTHPSSSDRYEKLILASTTENVDKYANTSCSSVKSRLRSVMNTSGGSNR